MVITYALADTYYRGRLIPIIQSCLDKLRIKCPLEYLQVHR